MYKKTISNLQKKLFKTHALSWAQYLKKVLNSSAGC